MYHATVLLGIVLVLVCSSTPLSMALPIAIPTNITKITVGLSTSIPQNTNDPAMKYLGGSAVNGSALFIEQLKAHNNQTVRIFGVDYPFEFKILDNFGNYTQDLINHQILCDDPEVFAIIGSVSTDFCAPAAMVTEACGKIFIPGCSIPNAFYENTQHEHTFQIGTMAEMSLAAQFPYLRTAQFKKIALLYALHPFTQTVCPSGALQAPNFDLEVVYLSALDHTFISANLTNVTLVLQEAIAAKPDVLIVCGFEQATVPIAKYLKANKVDLGLYIAMPDRTYSQLLTPDESAYMAFITKNHPKIKYSDIFFKSFQEYWNNYTAQFKVPAPFFAVFYYVAGHIITTGLENMIPKSSNQDCPCRVGTNDTLFTIDDLAFSLSRLNMDSLVSRVYYDAKHRSLTTEVLVQFHSDGTSDVVAPPVASSGKLIAPVPTWQERVYDPSLTTAEITFSAICGACILLSLIFIIVVLALRDTSLIVASMPSFLIAMLVGSILIYIGVIIWPNHGLTDVACHLRVWLIAIGFVMMFGCLLAKSYRVWYLWSYQTQASVVISNAQLSIFVGVAVFVTMILLAIYSGIGNVKAMTTVIDPIRPFYNIESCSNNLAGNIVIYIMIAFALLSIVVGLSFAFLTRKVSFLAFNESKIILFSMYNVTFFLILTVIVIALEMPVNIAYILRSLCIILSALLTILIMMGTKLWYVTHDKTARSRKSPKNSSLGSVKTGTASKNTKSGTGEGAE